MNETRPDDTGMELRDLLEDPAFAARTERPRASREPFQALSRVVRCFAQSTEEILQELVQIAVDYCGADSAGVSLEEPDPDGKPTFRWIAVAGTFSRYLHGRTPRFFSPCGTCLSRGRPQLYRVTKPYYDFLGIEAEPIREGILIPWVAGELRGTVWVVSHHSREAFDRYDYELLATVADFSVVAVHQRERQKLLRANDRLEASAARAHELAHRINNPLQSLTNTIFLATQGGADAQAYLARASMELEALSREVSKLLSLAHTPIMRDGAAPAARPS